MLFASNAMAQLEGGQCVTRIKDSSGVVLDDGWELRIDILLQVKL